MEGEAKGDQPLPSLVDEALRVSSRAAAADLLVRIAGGVAVAMRCPSARAAPLARKYADLDVAALAKQSAKVSQMLAELGYLPDHAFNTLHGSRRLFFWDPVNERQLDVFLDRVEMCHTIDLRSRLSLSGPTLALADLLLMKLQVVEANEKDLLDVLALLVDHELTEEDTEGINREYLATLMAGDWGLWRTVTMSLERVEHYAGTIAGLDLRGRVHAQVEQLLLALEEVPKTRSWKLRAKIGDRMQWYQLPEEAH